MKVRTGFVSNSSSSSFIVAFHKDCTQQEVIDLLSNEKEALSCVMTYWDDLSEEDVISDAVGLLFGYKRRGIELGDYTVIACEFSNEDDPEYAFLYDALGRNNTNHFIAKGQN